MAKAALINRVTNKATRAGRSVSKLMGSQMKSGQIQGDVSDGIEHLTRKGLISQQGTDEVMNLRRKFRPNVNKMDRMKRVRSNNSVQDQAVEGGNVWSQALGFFAPGAAAKQSWAKNVRQPWADRGNLNEQIKAARTRVRGIDQTANPEDFREAAAQLAELQGDQIGHTADAVKGLGKTAWDWANEPGTTLGTAGRIAGGLFAAGTVGRAVTGGGGPFSDRRGNFDIAGIPFI